MNIDLKSLVLGAIIGGCTVTYRASISVAKNIIKEDKAKKEEEINVKKVYVTEEELKRMMELVDNVQNLTIKSQDTNKNEAE